MQDINNELIRFDNPARHGRYTIHRKQEEETDASSSARQQGREDPATRGDYCDTESLVSSLQSWIQTETAKTKSHTNSANKRPPLSPVREILKAKDEIRAVQGLSALLNKAQNDLSAIIQSKEQKIRENFDSMSPLPALKSSAF